MFERFTQDARAVVKGAVEQAAAMGATSVAPGHLLLGLLEREGSRASFALAVLGGGEWKDAVRAEPAEVRRRGGLTQAGTEAPAGLGIDVAEIVARVEDTHGVGAPSGSGRGRRTGRIPFEKGEKEVLQGPCASPSPVGNGASGTSTSCSPSSAGPVSPPRCSPVTA